MPGDTSDMLAVLKGIAGLHPRMDQEHPSRKDIKPLQEWLAELHTFIIHTQTTKHTCTHPSTLAKSKRLTLAVRHMPSDVA